VSSSNIIAAPQPAPPSAAPADSTSGSARPPDSPARRLWHAFEWLRAFSWPRRFPIVQFPNQPLALAFVAGRAARELRGSAHVYAMAVSYLAMAVWAYLELTDGVNWFRRLLGAFYIASTVIHLERALNP
jgi:hypothetical protein